MIRGEQIQIVASADSGTEIVWQTSDRTLRYSALPQGGLYTLRLLGDNQRVGESSEAYDSLSVFTYNQDGEQHSLLLGKKGVSTHVLTLPTSPDQPFQTSQTFQKLRFDEQINSLVMNVSALAYMVEGTGKPLHENPVNSFHSLKYTENGEEKQLLFGKIQTGSEGQRELYVFYPTESGSYPLTNSERILGGDIVGYSSTLGHLYVRGNLRSNYFALIDEHGNRLHDKWYWDIRRTPSGELEGQEDPSLGYEPIILNTPQQ